MAAAVQIRIDYSGDELDRLARESEDADQARRLLELALILGRGSRDDAARTGGVRLQVIRDSLPVSASKMCERGPTVENIWLFLRDNWLSNHVFKNYADIVALCCKSWNKLMVRIPGSAVAHLLNRTPKMGA